MKKYQHLTQVQRYLIADLLSLGKTKASIGRELGVHRSTVTREIQRNGAKRRPYNAKGAHVNATGRRLHPIVYSRKIKGDLEQAILDGFGQGWSPENISRRLAHEGRWNISHESIYRWIYFVHPELRKYLRFGGKNRQRRGEKRQRRGLGRYARKMIDERPVAANERLERGHWERDLVEGRRGGVSLLVLSERQTRLMKVLRVESHHAEHVNERTIQALKGEVCRSVTNDNGVEFGKWESLEKGLGVPVFYTHAYAAWERGTVENTNGLIRHIYPKGTDFGKVSDAEIAGLEAAINFRPRRDHGYLSAYEIHYETREKLIKSNRELRRDRNKRLFEEFESYFNPRVALAP